MHVRSCFDNYISYSRSHFSFFQIIRAASKRGDSACMYTRPNLFAYYQDTSESTVSTEGHEKYSQHLHRFTSPSAFIIASRAWGRLSRAHLHARRVRRKVLQPIAGRLFIATWPERKWDRETALVGSVETPARARSAEVWWSMEIDSARGATANLREIGVISLRPVKLTR